MTSLIAALLALVLAPLAGALIQGLDRKVSARVQRRVGPPVLQPVYDVLKLFGKTPAAASGIVGLCAWGGLAGSAAAVMLLFAGQDLLLVFFTQAAGALFPAVGALASPSPYSKVGGQRELLLVAAYEPVLLLVLAAIGLASGGFDARLPLALDAPLLPRLPLAFAGLLLVLGVKARKSPFDAAASQHAHQELVRGVYTEYSGRYLALLETAHWFDTVLLYAVCALFWATSWWGMAVVAWLAWLAEILLDNASARLNWTWTLGALWLLGLTAAGINLAWLGLWGTCPCLEIS